MDDFYVAYEDSTHVRLKLVDQASNISPKTSLLGESNLGLVAIDRIRGTVAKAFCTSANCEVRFGSVVTKDIPLNEANEETPFALTIVERTADVSV